MELQGLALVANPANAQSFRVGTLSVGTVRGKLEKWWSLCRGEEWTCAVSKRLCGKWKA